MPHLPSDLPPVTIVVLALIAVALVLSEPVVGRAQYRRFLAEVADGGEPARLRHYARWIVQGWAWTVLVAGAVLVLPEVGLAELGLRGQDLNRPLTGLGISLSPSMLSGLAIGLVLGVVLLAVAVRRGQSQDPPNLEAVRPMLPTTRRGRWGWAGVSVTAGITEEILYRGLLVLVVTALAPDVPPGLLVLGLAVVFGMAHWYQGRVGMLSTGLAGALLTGLYLATGSLLLPILVHCLIDLRALLIPPVATSPVADPEADQMARMPPGSRPGGPGHEPVST